MYVEENPVTNDCLPRSCLVQMLFPLLLKEIFLYEVLFFFKTDDFMFDIKMAFLIVQYVHYMFTLQHGVSFKGKFTCFT